MIGRRATVGLSLLCALLFSAFVAQIASAAKGINTTAVTCVKEGGLEDFSDAHCDNKVSAFTGEYGHTSIQNDTTTELGVKGTEPAVLKAKAFGAAIEITCTTVSGSGAIHNVEHAGTKQHTTTGEVSNKLTNCTVNKPAKCIIGEPIEVKAVYEGVEGLGPGGNEMGVLFKPPAGETFVEITFHNKGAESCACNGKTIAVQGSVIATGAPSPAEKHSGSTSIVTTAMSSETLKVGGESASFSGRAAISMQGGNPIAFTTTT